MKLDVVITSDRSMMTNHRGKEFLGFMTTSPPIYMPERVWMWVCAPRPKVDEMGRPVEAPYGMRKIEAALLNAGINAAIVDPDFVWRYIGDAKILMLSHHDYFALASPSIEWWMITGKEPVNSRSFRRLMSNPRIREAKGRGLKIIVGGPGAWQWLWKPDKVREYGVDTIVEGEADRVVVDLVERALSGEEIPAYVFVGAEDSPSVEEIPVIRGASVNGLVEIMRGCPRGCHFCPVTLRPLRYYPLSKIEEELKVNAAHGVNRGLLHSEDVLLYGARGLEPSPEALLRLHQLAYRYYESIAWSHVTLAEVKYSQEKHGLISKLAELILERQEWIGVQVGLETGSRRLVRLHMPMKPLPYRPEEWPEVVVDAFSIMHEHRIVPAATLILGLPGEQEGDLTETLELLDRVKEYRSLVVPMFFVPLGRLKEERQFSREALQDLHVEILRRCFWHSAKWSEDIIERFYFREKRYAPVKLILKAFIRVLKWRVSSIERWLSAGRAAPREVNLLGRVGLPARASGF